MVIFNSSKTKIIGQVGVAQTYIDVDSTLGFPNSGTLSFLYENGTSGVCTYSDKTINQFLGINTTGITTSILITLQLIKILLHMHQMDDDDGIQVKIRGVLNNFIIPPDVNNQKIGSKIKIKNLGQIGKCKRK